uniref:Adenosine receptor B1a n=1 Tax=Cyprinodon variegatus TaxID=28743 RepID=A0A3Q2EHG2_CYPVA
MGNPLTSWYHHDVQHSPPSARLDPLNFSSVSMSPPPSADVVTPPNVPYMTAELIIAFLSTLGNLLVCAAVGLNSKLRTVTNYFLVSLAVADICVGMIAIPCAVLTGAGLPRYNLYLCLLMLSVLIMFTQSSIFSLLAVAVERYVAIFMPFRYRVLMTPRNAVLVILATWFLAFLIGLVPLMGWHKTPPDSGYCFFVLVIFVTVKQQVRRIGPDQRSRADGQSRAAASMRREMKMATSLFLVLFLFTVCWIPLHIINCFLLLCPSCPVPLELLLAAIILSHANSAVNPFLYAYTMTAFRDTFKAIFLCCTTFRSRDAPNLSDRGEETNSRPKK